MVIPCSASIVGVSMLAMLTVQLYRVERPCLAISSYLSHLYGDRCERRTISIAQVTSPLVNTKWIQHSNGIEYPPHLVHIAPVRMYRPVSP